MGIYTNHVNGYYASSDYRDVEPYHGEHFNYQELGIIAASESVANRNAFMKAIALNELASVEQYGTEQVFYEAVNLSSIFEKIKAFFKKIIEKIHKIFHTFVAKLNSWFGSSKDFAKKYRSEVIKNWSLVKSDWEFKGYKFRNVLLTKSSSEGLVNNIKTKKTEADSIENLLKSTNNASEFEALLREMAKKTAGKPYTSKKGTKYYIYNGKKVVKKDDGKWYDEDDKEIDVDEKKAYPATNRMFNSLKTSDKNSFDSIDVSDIAKFRENFNEKGKDQIRYQVVEGCKKAENVTTINCDFDDSGSYDASEFTEELHKVFYGEDEKEDLEKKDIESMYGGSITNMLAFMEDYSKIKDNIEKAEKNVVKSIDGIINAIDKAQNNIIKDKDESNKEANEVIVQISTVFQSFWGFVKECETQAFSTLLQATKDFCSQAKQIAVEVIGLSKKMTESYDYSSSYEYNSYDNDFISSVKLV